MPELQPRQRKPGWKHEARTTSKIIRKVFGLLDASPYSYRSAALKAGLGTETLTKMKFGHHSPKVVSLESLVEALGYELDLRRAGALNDAPRAAALALRVRGEIVDVTLDENKAAIWAGKGWEVVRLTEEENEDV